MGHGSRARVPGPRKWDMDLGLVSRALGHGTRALGPVSRTDTDRHNCYSAQSKACSGRVACSLEFLAGQPVDYGELQHRADLRSLGLEVACCVLVGVVDADFEEALSLFLLAHRQFLFDCLD